MWSSGFTVKTFVLFWKGGFAQNFHSKAAMCGTVSATSLSLFFYKDSLCTWWENQSTAKLTPLLMNPSFSLHWAQRLQFQSDQIAAECYMWREMDQRLENCWRRAGMTFDAQVSYRSCETANSHMGTSDNACCWVIVLLVMVLLHSCAVKWDFEKKNDIHSLKYLSLVLGCIFNSTVMAEWS